MNVAGIPSGDLATLVERAFDVLLEKLERQRLGKTKRAPRATNARPSKRRGYIPVTVRREVFERDGEQCTFVDELGRRCSERAFLELDHRVPCACGGTSDAANLTVKCRRHNALAAERAFGRQFVEKRKAERTQRLRQRGYDDVTAARALRGLGFKEAEIRRALSTLEELWAGSPPPLETILREAIHVLT
jgi:5-methylcytosine-specific restriction endonuclease McrA